MGRSVVLSGATRCPRCRLPPRWCVCDALPPVETRLGIHVLIHRQERSKPSSTGRLVARVVAGAGCHVYQRATAFHAAAGLPDDAIDHGRELWILHPSGGPLPAAPSAVADRPDRGPQVVLLDGTWRQAGEMLRAVTGRGRRMRLADAGPDAGRYWLRDQPTPGQRSTAEALMGVLHAVGDREAERQLRLHFELHVYATLLARGRRETAERYLGHSPLLDAPDVLERLHHRRHTA